MPEGGPRGESFTQEPAAASYPEQKPDEQSADFDVDKRRQRAAAEELIEKIARGEINYASTEDFRADIATGLDKLDQDEQARLANIFTVALERKKVIEKCAGEAQRLGSLARLTERSLRGDYANSESFRAQIEQLDPAPSPELRRALLKQYELARSALAETSRNRDELAVADEYKTIICDVVRSELSDEDVEDAIDTADPKLPETLEENIREAARIFARIPSSTRTAFLKSLDIENAQSAITELRIELSREKFPIPRDEARVTINKLASALKERSIVRSLAVNEFEEATAKLRDLSNSPARPPRERLQELSERARILTIKTELQIIYGRLLVQLRPNFDPIFTSIDRLDALPDAGDLAEQARDIAVNFELTQFETQFEPFEELSPISRLEGQLELISNLPERSATYARKKEELTKRAYDREVASIQLSYGSASIEKIRARLNALPAELQPALKNQYQTFISRRSLETLGPEKVTAESTNEKTDTPRPKINFFNAEVDEPRNFDPATEPATAFADNFTVSEQGLRQLYDQIDQLGSEISPADNFRLKKLVAANAEIIKLDEERGRARSESIGACRLALRIIQNQLSPDAIAVEIKGNTFPPALADRLTELGEVVEKFTAKRIIAEKLAESYSDISGFADRILANSFLTKKQFEAALNEPNSNFSNADRAKLTMLFEMVNSLPTAARVALNRNGGALAFDNSLFTRIRDTLRELTIDQSESSRRAQEQTLRDTEQALAFINTRRRVARNLSEGNVTEALASLSTYTPQTPEEQTEINTLYRLAIERNISEQTSRVLTRLGTSSADFNSVYTELSKLSQLRETSDISPIEICQTIRSLTTIRETDEASYVITPSSLTGQSLYEGKLLDIEQQLPIRDEKYLAVINKLKAEVLENEYASIELCFYLETANTVLGRIARLPESTREQVRKKKLLFQEFVDFIAEKRDKRPEDYATTSEVEVSQVMQGTEYVFQPENLGNNLAAAAYIKANYRISMHSWVETLRADNTDEVVGIMNAIAPKNRYNAKAIDFRRSTREFRKQRPLSEREQAYLESIRALTGPNPPMVAAARADFGSTTAYVNAYLEQLSRKTKERIKDGQYYPIIIIGTGPGGMTAMGSIVRKRPDLAGQTLIVDQAEQVGGPFGVPKGPAWRLNSANQQKDKEFIPDPLPLSDEQTVRGYGSPVRGYVAERRMESPDSRDFSINMTSSFGVTPDQISPNRYATNEEVATTMGLQAATMCERIALTTRVIESKRAPEDGQPGKRLVKLEITEGKITRIVNIRTDLLIPASGSGKESFGFSLEGSRAEQVRNEDSQKPEIPRISTYLEMLNSLADRTKPQEEKRLGETVVIWGGPGDSERTMKEKLTRIFGESNEATRNVRKVFVIKRNKQEIKRPRYGEIPDVIDRPNRRSIITEIAIDGRVADVGPDPDNPNKIVFYDDGGDIIVDPKTQRPISADNAVSTAGFNSDIATVFEEDLQGKKLSDVVKPYTLPGAPDIAVADTLGDDKSVLFVQVASNPRFNEAKFNAIPEKTRATLLAIDGNLVAIGVRSADTEAALNTALDELNGELKPSKNLPEINKIELKHVTNIGASDFTVPITIDREKSRIPNNSNPNRVASALLSQSLMNYEFKNAGSTTATKEDLLNGTYKVGISIPKTTEGSNEWKLSFTTGIPGRVAGTSLPKAVGEELKHTFTEPAFQANCWQILKNKRGNQPVAVATLSFKRGRIQPAESYVE